MDLLKWRECNFEIFSNIKLIALKKYFYVVFYMDLKRKNSIYGSPAKNCKIGDGDRRTIASYEKSMNDLLKIFRTNQKILNFLCTIYSLSFNLLENSFIIIIIERGKIPRKKLMNIFPCYLFPIRKLLNCFFEILPRSTTKNK
jgi:hypothetical protein